MIHFLPTTLNQLFRVLTSATHEEVAVNVTKSVVLVCVPKWHPIPPQASGQK